MYAKKQKCLLLCSFSFAVTRSFVESQFLTLVAVQAIIATIVGIAQAIGSNQQGTAPTTNFSLIMFASSLQTAPTPTRTKYTIFTSKPHRQLRQIVHVRNSQLAVTCQPVTSLQQPARQPVRHISNLLTHCATLAENRRLKGLLWLRTSV